MISILSMAPKLVSFKAKRKRRNEGDEKAEMRRQMLIICIHQMITLSLMNGLESNPLDKMEPLIGQIFHKE